MEVSANGTQLLASAGATMLGGGAVACEVGTWKGVAGNGSCTACAPGTTTLTEGALAVTACVCDYGYQPSGRSCMPCGAGTVKLVVGQEDCISLSRFVGNISSSNVSMAANASSTIDLLLPLVVASDGPLLSAAVQEALIALPSGSVSMRLRQSPPSLSLLANGTAVGCVAGWVALDGACYPCPLGTFRGSTDARCVPCGVGTTTVFAAASSALQCVCAAGFASNFFKPTSSPVPSSYLSITCVSCSIDTFKMAAGNQFCGAVSECDAGWGAVLAPTPLLGKRRPGRRH